MKLKVEMLDERERTGRKGSATASALTLTAVPISTLSSARLPFDFVKSSSFKAIVSPAQSSALAPIPIPVPVLPSPLDTIVIPLATQSSLSHIITEPVRIFSTVSTSTSTADLPHIAICASCSSNTSTVGTSDHIVESKSIDPGTETGTGTGTGAESKMDRDIDGGSNRIIEEKKKTQETSFAILHEMKDKMTQTIEVAQPPRIEIVSLTVTPPKIIPLEPERKKSSQPIIAIKKLSTVMAIEDILFKDIEKIALPVESEEVEVMQAASIFIDKDFHPDKVERVLVPKESKEIDSAANFNFGLQFEILEKLDDATAIDDENSDTEDDEDGEEEREEEREEEKGDDKKVAVEDEVEAEDRGGKVEMGKVGVREKRIHNSRITSTTGLGMNSYLH